MKLTLVVTLGLVILAGCAVQGPAMDAPVVAVKQQEVLQDNTAPTEPVVAQRQDFFVSSRGFLAENLKKPGVKELPGGIQYRVLQAGSGVSPKSGDTVDIHFVTTRVDGSMIATTRVDKDSPPRSYLVTKLNRSLQPAVLMMKPGSRWEVVIPPSNRSKITERNGALIYDLELLAVHPAAN